jgi:teichuronic acid biosynthesis glycosyltransferase TuaH
MYLDRDELLDLVKQCADAIEWANRSADGKYHPVFDSAFLQKLKGALVPSMSEELFDVRIDEKQRVIVYPPTIDWTWMFQRPQQILSQFAKDGWRVIYANKTQRKGAPPTKVMPNLEVWHDWELLKKTIKRVDVLWISWAFHHDANLDAKVVVYDCLDDFDVWDKYESQMLKRANIVFTTSEVLYKKHSGHHKRVIMVRNACDPNYIGSRVYPVPSELVGLKKPIIGFIGALGSWIDVPLLDKIATKYSLVIIGPKLGKEPPRRAKYLGTKNYSQLPCYYSNIDLGIIPFEINRVSLAANPIKMYEYMAAGKPVVATNIPECGLYPEVVFKSKGHEEFIGNINKAIGISNCSSTARSIALENSWGARYQVIKGEIEKLL